MHPRTGFIDFATLLLRSFFVAMAQAGRLRRQGHLFQADSDDFPLSADACGFGAAEQAGMFDGVVALHPRERVSEYQGAL